MYLNSKEKIGNYQRANKMIIKNTMEALLDKQEKDEKKIINN